MPTVMSREERESVVQQEILKIPEESKAEEDEVQVESGKTLKGRVMYNIILILNQDSQVPGNCRYLQSHANLVLDPNVQAKVVTAVQGKQNFSSLDVYKENLQQKLDSLGEWPEESFIKSVMLQVTRGLDHLHKQGKAFGDISASDVFISCHAENVVLTNVSTDNDELPLSSDKRATDIKHLANFFGYLLTKESQLFENSTDSTPFKCLDKGAAKHLLKSMQKEFFTDDILQHPFFWDDAKKINFLCEAFDRVKHLERKQKIDEGSCHVTDGDWIQKLTLYKKEKTKIENKMKRDKNKKKQIGQDTIRNLAKGATAGKKVDFTTYLFEEGTGNLFKINSLLSKNWNALAKKIKSDSEFSENDSATKSKKIQQAVKLVTTFSDPEEYEVFGKVVLVKADNSFQCDSTFDLLRFFRNRKAHYWESNENITRCFQNYPHGFWNFFSSRYPELLPFVYENREKFELTSVGNTT